MYKSIALTEDELRALDDWQDWYTPEYDVYLGGYLPDDGDPNPAFDLSVNGDTYDNWMYWADMPGWLQQRVRAG